MDKSKLNFLIDAVMFLCMMALAGLGLLIKYVLVPGRQAWEIYGRKVELTWLGLDRHVWGDIHFYLASLLLGLLVFHIILHWKMILGLFQKMIEQPGRRRFIAVLFVMGAALLIGFFAFAAPEIQEFDSGRGRQLGRLHEGVPTPASILCASDLPT